MLKNVFLLIIILFVSVGQICAQGLDQNFDPEHISLPSSESQKLFKEYWQAFKDNPDDIKINYQLGIIASKIGDYETAVMSFDRVLIVDPDAVQAKIEIAKAFYKLGSLETAKQYFIEAIQADPPEDVRKDIENFLKDNL